jgi:hypothetical protein
MTGSASSSEGLADLVMTTMSHAAVFHAVMVEIVVVVIMVVVIMVVIAVYVVTESIPVVVMMPIVALVAVVIGVLRLDDYRVPAFMLATYYANPTCGNHRQARRFG